jgi:hypothetical protein
MRSKAFTQLKTQVENRRRYFLEVMDFVRQNQDVVESIKHSWLAKVIQADSAKMKIRTLYIDTINAAGGNNLELTGESCENLFNIVDRLDDRALISLGEFYQLFGDSIKTHRMLFEGLVENEYLSNFSKKKAALFLRHIHIIHTRGRQESRFIYDYNINRDELVVPVDIVIVTVLNKIWGTDLKPGDHFDAINDIAKDELGDDFMLVEDLWFWGYFNTRVVKRRQEVDKEFDNNLSSASAVGRVVSRQEFDKEINKAKYYSADFIYPNDNLWKKLGEFSQIINVNS